MSEKNLNKSQPDNRRDYRIVILLVAGLLLGCNAWRHASGMNDQAGQGPDRKEPIHASSILSTQDAISVKMRPFLFMPVPLNSADGTLLETIPGIGPQLAERIIALRSARNGFHDVAELLDVDGIGPQKFAAIKGFCSL
ncbi:MAG: helix-hairpin-helix domain-containing protein [Deltaproteobacteria bacterium]|nr:helix-hairpin-helix domain-containing protein [Deltaproteobacteria bacterium]